ncbi:MAG: hypothetical protein CYPHOPRED_004066 [Cyphobasidiales sp. Tagirdzhanova-0007]|nr:MAG: hypothetical protein CYPHOPRED_004066 [Cyphobasidiales sp. Tagirdzhanova-0007]
MSTIMVQQLHYYMMITSLNIMSTIWTVVKLNSPQQQGLTGTISVSATQLFPLHLALSLKADAYAETSANQPSTSSKLSLNKIANSGTTADYSENKVNVFGGRPNMIGRNDFELRSVSNRQY